jgi:hypothetical protein
MSLGKIATDEVRTRLIGEYGMDDYEADTVMEQHFTVPLPRNRPTSGPYDEQRCSNPQTQETR